MEELLAAFRDPGLPARLDRAAIEVARFEYPDLRMEDSLRTLDEIAAALRRGPAGTATGAAFVSAMNGYLFGELGFRGNATDYYDVRNSCLNQVLERRTGLPILLSVVYMEVARRLGKTVEGIGLPGHFVVRFVEGAYATYIDPFHAGRTLTREQCLEIAREHAGGAMPDASALRPMRTSDILLRILNNLQAAYFRAQAYAQSLRVIEFLFAQDAGRPELWKASAFAKLALRQFRAARADFTRYLELLPEAQDRDTVVKQIVSIDRWLASVN